MKMDQHTHKAAATILCAAVFLFFGNSVFSQSWQLTGNANVASGSQYLGTKDQNDLVFRTNGLERGRVFGAGGNWRLGSPSDYVKIDTLGHLSFAGAGVLRIGNNKYVFQSSANNSAGLFYNSTTPQYEFRSSTAAPVFTVNASTGAGNFLGKLTVGAYTLPNTDGTNGQVLKTNGSGVVSWGSVGSFWTLTGNAGTSPATNFIGTTDSKPFVFRTNNLERMRIGTGGAVGIGTATPQGNLNVIGLNTVSLATAGLFQLGDSASYNIGMDNEQIQARYNGSATSLYLNNYGGTIYAGSTSNSYYGLVGYGSQYGFYGYTPGSTGVYGQGSTYGVYGYNSSGVGVYGYDDGTGHGVYGYEAGGGEGVDGFAYGSGGWGVEAYSSQSYGLYASTGSGTYAGYFNGSVYSTGGFVTSDERLKQNIHDFTGAMSIISKLHPRQYKFRHDGNYKLMNLPAEEQYGLIAQDVEKILPALVKDTKLDVDKASNVAPRAPLDPSNKNAQPKAAEQKKTGEVIDFKALNYTALIPIMIKGMQEQQETISKQQQQIDELKTMVATLAQAKGTNVADNAATAVLSSAMIEQNIPNPLSNSASIRYNIPAGAGNASIAIKDMNGKAIKQISLQTGAGNITIDASTLSSGAYSYTLIVNGKNIMTKKMIVSK